jgi:hypothetical protein
LAASLGISSSISAFSILFQRSQESFRGRYSCGFVRFKLHLAPKSTATAISEF